MAIKSPVPAQIESVKYLEQVAKKLQGNFYVMGHSKGGNLPVLAYKPAPAKTPTNKEE